MSFERCRTVLSSRAPYTICYITGILGFEPSSEAQAGNALSLSQCRVSHRERRGVDIIAADPSSYLLDDNPRIDVSLSPPLTNASCVPWKPSHVACAERGDSERKHGVRGGGGDPCGILQTFLHLAKSTQDQGDLTGAAPGSTVVSQTY